MKHNLVSWFEIPVIDIERAAKFYSTVFDVNIQIQDFNGVKMGWFPPGDDKPGASGALIQFKDYRPSRTDGALLYFNSETITKELKLIQDNGGEVLQEKTEISAEIGHMAVFIDTEGNRVALYASA